MNTLSAVTMVFQRTFEDACKSVCPTAAAVVESPTPISSAYPPPVIFAINLNMASLPTVTTKFFIVSSLSISQIRLVAFPMLSHGHVH